MKRVLNFGLALSIFLCAVAAIGPSASAATLRSVSQCLSDCPLSRVSVYNGCGYDPYGYPGRLDTNGFGPFGYNGTYYTGYNGYSTYAYNPTAFAEPYGYGGYSYRNSGMRRTMGNVLQNFF